MEMAIRIRVLILVAATSCVGAIDDAGSPGGGERFPPVAGMTGGTGGSRGMSSGTSYQRSAARRLTKGEIRDTIKALLDVDPSADMDGWPQDSIPRESAPFDNVYHLQAPSPALVQAAKSVAEGVARSVVSDSMRLAKVVGCSSSDPSCLGRFITAFGRRSLRRPLAPAEVTA